MRRYIKKKKMDNVEIAQSTNMCVQNGADICFRDAKASSTVQMLQRAFKIEEYQSDAAHNLRPPEKWR